jgi:broad specificity phosphatase PhoE
MEIHSPAQARFPLTPPRLALNSFLADPQRRNPQTTALEAWLAEHEANAPLVLVTHQVNIRALTGACTGSGEIVVARRQLDGRITVLAKL